MRVAFFSPLPPSATGVARYAANLLPELMKRAEVEVFVEAKRSRSQFDRRIYQVGNNRLHLFAYQAALEEPGVVVLHDALLQHLLLGISWEAWESEFAFAYGERGAEIARNLRGGSPAMHEGFFRYPLVKRLAERSKAVIVHNPEAARRVLAEAPRARVEVAPLPFIAPAKEPDGVQARVDLGIPPGSFVVGFFGYVRPPRRLEVALRVFAALRKKAQRAEFLLAGEFTSREQESFLAPQLSELGVRRTGYVSDADFDRYAAACDVVINLRHPSAGETSGVGVGLMGLGVPLVLSDIPENALYPSDSCIRVPPGEMEEEMLLEYLLALEANPALGKAIGANARRYIRAQHSLARYVDAMLLSKAIA